LIQIIRERLRSTEMPYYYLSFCDPIKPKGQHFLGCAIVEAPDEVSAVLESHMRKINPGGEVVIVGLGTEVLPPEYTDWLNRFTPRDVVMAEPHSKIFDEGE
jgi:altronate dehydratase